MRGPPCLNATIVCNRLGRREGMLATDEEQQGTLTMFIKMSIVSETTSM